MLNLMNTMILTFLKLNNKSSSDIRRDEISKEYKYL